MNGVSDLRLSTVNRGLASVFTVGGNHERPFSASRAGMEAAHMRFRQSAFRAGFVQAYLQNATETPIIAAASIDDMRKLHLRSAFAQVRKPSAIMENYGSGWPLQLSAGARAASRASTTWHAQREAREASGEPLWRELHTLGLAFAPKSPHDIIENYGSGQPLQAPARRYGPGWGPTHRPTHGHRLGEVRLAACCT